MKRLLAGVHGLLILAVLSGVAAAAPAETTAGGVRARLVDVPVLRGDFVQEKTLQGFRNPLRSSGTFMLARSHGVVWTTLAPFRSTIVLTSKQLTVRRADGSAAPLAGQGGSQAIATANALLMALLSGRVDSLSSQFTVTETLLPNKAWRLVLVPKPGALQSVFKRIQLQGDDHVRSVALEEANGDRTNIEFMALRDAPSSLTTAERKQFD